MIYDCGLLYSQDVSVQSALQKELQLSESSHLVKALDIQFVLIQFFLEVMRRFYFVLLVCQPCYYNENLSIEEN